MGTDGHACPSVPITAQKVRARSPSGPRITGGEEEDRTPDLRIANAALSQLSYPPTRGAKFTIAPSQFKERA
jgi:hypothetical protein